jgi:hypothetical protein
MVISTRSLVIVAPSLPQVTINTNASWQKDGQSIKLNISVCNRATVRRCSAQVGKRILK